MANGFVFQSPTAKFKELDLSAVSKRIGATFLGLVGETPKGPAFEAIPIGSKGDLRSRFGDQSVEKYSNGDLRYPLLYAANAYLGESDQLTVTRVLGLEGYNAGRAFALTLSAGLDVETTGNTTTASTTSSFTNGVYLGTTITGTGQTGVIFTGFTKINATNFRSLQRQFTVTSFSSGSGNVNVLETVVTGRSLSDYEGMVLAIVRSRATVTDIVDAAPVTNFAATALSIIQNSTTIGTGDMFAKFTLRATSGSTTEDYVVSLDPDGREFITNVLGDKPKGKNNKIYVESVFPDLIRKLDADGVGYGINTTVITSNNANFTDYRESYKTPETPWVVSELRGNKIDRLFKFISISDGNSANKEIKISFVNIDPISKEFDIIIRDFYDTDDNVSILESFSRCTMQKGLNNYVGNRIGTLNGDFSIQSKYVALEIDENAPIDAFPAGFEGYIYYSFATGSTGFGSLAGKAPQLFFKDEYLDSDKLSKTYLGISERGYDGVNLKGTGINQNMFNYIGLDISSSNGNAPSGYLKTKGFHMDSTATGTSYTDGSTVIGAFIVGQDTFQTASDVTDPTNIYSNKSARKFTFVPYGGFDGWNEHRIRRSNTDNYRKGGVYDGVAAGATPSNDYQAWEIAFQQFENTEEVVMNLFATPGINFSDNLGLVNTAIDLCEETRVDSLYIIDAPDLPNTSAMAQDIVDLLDGADLDTSWAATFYPWIQIRDDVNSQNVYIPPTGEVLAAMAFTDKIKFPWFAAAGLQRGVTDALRARRKFSLAERDIIYDGRVNPLPEFANTGVAIFGNKTLQKKDSALDRINVRRLLIQLKTLIANVSTRLLFEQNDQTTVDEFIAKVTPILQNIQRERGISEFKLVMDDTLNTPETRDRNELYGNLYLKPVASLEFIGFTFIVTPSGANFQNI